MCVCLPRLRSFEKVSSWLAERTDLVSDSHQPTQSNMVSSSSELWITQSHLTLLLSGYSLVPSVTSRFLLLKLLKKTKRTRVSSSRQSGNKQNNFNTCGYSMFNTCATYSSNKSEQLGKDQGQSTRASRASHGARKYVRDHSLTHVDITTTLLRPCRIFLGRNAVMRKALGATVEDECRLGVHKIANVSYANRLKGSAKS